MTLLWEEPHGEAITVVPDTVQDLSFTIEASAVRIDHAEALYQAVVSHLPWFADTPNCALHLIHGGESGNGWQRPDGDDAVIQLSRRTRLRLRLPKERLADARVLEGKTLSLDGYPVQVGTASERPLALTSALYSRHVVDVHDDEPLFLQQAIAQLQGLGLRIVKIVAGRAHRLQIGNERLTTRSLFIADMRLEDAILLQQQGLGCHQRRGCGIFIPHKTPYSISR
ncbi:MAG: type I-MYXAN CRISPR-associated protein Cas6/Cmx6 [Gammaproteobacteria bacterium]|nr:type I-MYXAN CRISPR-associated protein Cas6/Cmx6 [Gammaproteobacteria bacterium]